MSQPDDMSPDDDDSVSASLRNLNIILMMIDIKIWLNFIII